MSLARPQQNPRLSSVLPGLTCSSCAAQIPLGHLGEHVCASSSRPAHPPRRPSGPFHPRPDATHALPVAQASSLAARAPPLKIDLAAVSNWTEARKDVGAAGMAGVGRRGFGMDYDGASLLLPEFFFL